MAKKHKDVAMYCRGPAVLENRNAKLMRAVLDYNKYEAKWWRVSVAMTQTCRAAGTPVQGLAVKARWSEPLWMYR